MVRPTATNRTVPPSRAKELQALMAGPRVTADLPARIDEMQMLEDIGVVTSGRLGEGRVSYRRTLVPGALDRVGAVLRG